MAAGIACARAQPPLPPLGCAHNARACHAHPSAHSTLARTTAHSTQARTTALPLRRRCVKAGGGARRRRRGAVTILSSVFGLRHADTAREDGDRARPAPGTKRLFREEQEGVGGRPDRRGRVDDLHMHEGVQEAWARR